MSPIENTTSSTPDSPAGNSGSLLSARQLTRWEGERCIAHDINLSLRRGEVLGLLGLNGAGKSTTLNMLAGVMTPSSGDVVIAGYPLHGLAKDARKARSHLGYLPETPPLYMDMKVGAYLDYCGKLHGLRGKKLKHAKQTVLEDCQLQVIEKRLIRNLSKGYRQRLGIAQALIHRPDVILLDEPSSGLDPQQMIGMRELIHRLAQQHAIVFSTHLLSEATAVCNRICVIHEGRVIHQQHLNPQADTAISSYSVKLNARLSHNEIMSLPGVLRAIAASDGRWHLDVQASQHNLLLADIVNNGWTLSEFGPRRQALEELFTSLVSGQTPADAKSGELIERQSHQQIVNQSLPDNPGQTVAPNSGDSIDPVEDAPTLMLEREDQS